MNATEALHLTRLVASLAPGTKIDTYTPAAWAVVLADVSLADAQEAMRRVYLEQGNDREFGARRLEADDIYREVRRMRAARIEQGPDFRPSSPDLTGAEQAAELRAHRRALAAGEPSPYADNLAQLEARPDRQIRRALTKDANVL